MISIFLSYARGDDGEPFDPASSFVARLHEAMTTAGFHVWFDRVSMPSRALTFHQEIRDAVAGCDRLVLLVGPKAAESLYVRQEWQFAYFEAEKIVTPILRRGDYSNVPDELKLLHCEDFRDDGQYDIHLKNLIRQLAEPAPSLGKLIGVPSLPPHFLSRADRLTALRDALRADLDRPVVITGTAARVGMHGMGGIGKSVLAATLAHDRKIREAFPDGIVWVGLGPLPAVADLQRRVHKDLGDDGAFQNEHEGRVKLRDILKDKGVLLILDDVWRREDVDWFDVLGPRCRALITTRDASLLTSLGGVHHQVDLLTDAEALNLVAQAAGVEHDKLPAEAADLIGECGRLPLAVALSGGLIRHGFAWAKVLEQLRTSRIDRINDSHATNFKHKSIWDVIDVSVNFLGADEQRRFLELAAFPPNEATPIAAIQTLWSHTAGFDDWDTDALVIKLSQRSLLGLTSSSDNTAISLHDLVYDYVYRAAGDEIALHQKLLDSYKRKCPDGWHVAPPNDGYFFTHLRHHLVAAGRAGELADLLHDLRWLEAKNEAGLTFDLTKDFDAVMKALPGSDIRHKCLEWMEEALRRDIHFISRHALDYPQGLFQCLWNSCWWYDCAEAAIHYEPIQAGALDQPRYCEEVRSCLAPMLEEWRIRKEKTMPGFCWLRTLRPPSTHLGTAQKVVFRGHESGVYSVAFSPDGQRVISGASDFTIRIWDAISGAELRCLRGHEGEVISVASSPDGQYLVSGSGDHTVRIWDVAGGELLCLRGHEKSVISVAYSPDGRWIVSGSEDGTVRVWDVARGEEIRCLRGHKDCVNSVMFSPDGKCIVSAGSDETLGIWDAANGVQLRCLRGPEYSVDSIAFSPDGRRVVGSNYRTLRVWDAASWTQLHCLSSGQDFVRSAAFSPDGQRIVSGARNNVHVWDAVNGVELQCLYGHDGEVWSVGYSLDGQRIVSGAMDRTVCVWDATVTKLVPLRRIRGHVLTVWSLGFSPDGRHLVSGSDDGTVRIWDTASGAELRCIRAHMSGVHSVTYSPDGQCLASGSRDETVRVWDAGSGAQLHCLCGHEGGVNGVEFSPDGQRLITTSVRNGIKRIWDTASGTCLEVKQPPPVARVVALPRAQASERATADTGLIGSVVRNNREGDVLAVASGAPAFPWRVVRRELETVVVSSISGVPLALLPLRLSNVVSHPSGRTWAGSEGTTGYVCLFTLEGNAPAEGAKPTCGLSRLRGS